MDLLAATAALASAPQSMQVQFLRNLNGPDPADATKEVLVFSRGQTVSLPSDEAKHWMDQGLAQPMCEAAKAWCQSKGLTDAKLLAKFKATCLLMDKGEIHTAEPASISEPA